MSFRLAYAPDSDRKKAGRRAATNEPDAPDHDAVRSSPMALTTDSGARHLSASTNLTQPAPATDNWRPIGGLAAGLVADVLRKMQERGRDG